MLVPRQGLFSLGFHPGSCSYLSRQFLVLRSEVPLRTVAIGGSYMLRLYHLVIDTNIINQAVPKTTCNPFLIALFATVIFLAISAESFLVLPRNSADINNRAIPNA